MKLIEHIKTFLSDEEGASGIEYALIAAMVAAAIATVALGKDGIGAKVEKIFTDLNADLVKK